LGKEISVLLERSGSQGIFLPEIRLEVTVGVTKSVEKSLDEVTHGTGVTTGGGVAILNTSHGQKTLSTGGGNQSSTTGGRDETNTDGTTLSSHLGGDSVGHATLTSPESTTDGGDVELGGKDGTTDGGGNLRGALDSKTDVSIGVSNGNEGLETSTLTSRTLLLNRHDLHDLILELVLQEVVDDLGLLNRDGEEEDLLNGSNLSLLYETSELGDGDPNVFVTSTLTSASTATSSAATTVSASTSSSSSETSAFFRHCIAFKLVVNLGLADVQIVLVWWSKRR
ncbi:hypothetical protein QTG54_013368, partial [Skeletonema marinoi]